MEVVAELVVVYLMVHLEDLAEEHLKDFQSQEPSREELQLHHLSFKEIQADQSVLLPTVVVQEVVEQVIQEMLVLLEEQELLVVVDGILYYHHLHMELLVLFLDKDILLVVEEVEEVFLLDQPQKLVVQGEQEEEVLGLTCLQFHHQ
jgi:hypothetical protein